MNESRKWVDLHPGKQHEFGTRVRLLGHARMNDGAVRLYYEEIPENMAIGAGARGFGGSAQFKEMIQESEQTKADGYVFDSRDYENVDMRLPGPMLEVEVKPKKPEKSGGKKEK